MSDLTFKQACEATGKTNAEIAELAGVKESTVEMYQKTDKPSQALKTVVAELLGGKPNPETTDFQTLSVDRERVPGDYEDNDEWHYLHVRDSSPGGRDAVAAQVAQLQAGIVQEAGHGKRVTIRYGIAHKFSDTYVVMRCPQDEFRALEVAAVTKSKVVWEEQKANSEAGGLSTTIRREERFIQAPGEPALA